MKRDSLDTYVPAGRASPVLYLLHSTHASASGMITVSPESGRSWLVNDARDRALRIP